MLFNQLIQVDAFLVQRLGNPIIRESACIGYVGERGPWIRLGQSSLRNQFVLRVMVFIGR
ncbi:hypothetical protein RSAG8_05456, partial [Rhizoctonia solani AG-8 WAC10335]